VDISDAVARAIDDLRSSLRKTGKVTGTSGTKVIVTVQGSSMTLPRLASYTPTVNDVVNIDSTIAGSWLVLGKTA
jgi:hypothetical protein